MTTKDNGERWATKQLEEDVKDFIAMNEISRGKDYLMIENFIKEVESQAERRLKDMVRHILLSKAKEEYHGASGYLMVDDKGITEIMNELNSLSEACDNGEGA